MANRGKSKRFNFWIYEREEKILKAAVEKNPDGFSASELLRRGIRRLFSHYLANTSRDLSTISANGSNLSDNAQIDAVPVTPPKSNPGEL